MKKLSLTILFCFAAVSLFAQGTRPGLTREVRPALRPAALQQLPGAVKTEETIAPAAAELTFDGTNNPALKFVDAPATILLETYANATQKTLLIAPNLPKVDKITLRSHENVKLSKEEYLQAIEAVLVMHNISILPAGEKFVRVLPANELRKLGIETHFQEPENGEYVENGTMVSQIIQLKNISYEEAKKAIEGMKRNEGQIQIFERTNSILITDTVENVNRMMEILKYIDIPIENREETHVRPIKFAKASDIKTRLEEIIKEAMAEQQKKTTTTAEPRQWGAPGFDRRTPPGTIRPRLNNTPAQQAQPAATDTANAIHETLVSDAERGIIRGKVQIIADERTNLLIFITRPDNMKFFDKIIDVLDVQVQTVPDVIVNVFRLEYATAKDVATMLNDLIGNTQKNDSKDKDNPNLNTRNSNNSNRPGESSSLSDFASRQRQAQQASNAGKAFGEKNKIGELNKENVTILADERSNAIIVMASPADMLSVESIIKQMDIQLSQVVIETVILSVTFGDTLDTGMDWVQRAMLGYQGNGTGTPTLAFATSGGGGTGRPQNTSEMTSIDKIPSSGGVNAWITLFDYNLDFVLKAVQTDNRAHIISSPRITTMDNEEATLESTERIYWNAGTTYYENSGNQTQNVKSEDIGIKLTVKPRIYNKGFITLKVNQSIQNNAGYRKINEEEYPNLSTRTMEASVSVQSGETVVLGGLAQNSVSVSKTKVPVLGSIPLLGWFFRSEKEEKSRTEIIVFLTPRVVDTPAEMEDDARRIKASIDTDGVWDAGWSHSRLADPLPEDKAKQIIKNAENTVSPPRYPLSGYLAGLNEGTNSNIVVKEAIDEAKKKGTVPYVHFSDMPKENIHENTDDITVRIGGLNYSETTTIQTNTPSITE